MATHTITKRNGETITFDTDLTVDQAGAALLADIDRNCRPLQGFAFDLVNTWQLSKMRGVRFSETQQLWLLKLAADLQQPQQQGAKPSVFQGLVDAMARLQEGRKGRVILRLQGVTLKFCTMGGNAGGIYLSRGDSYLGKITSAGRLFVSGLGEQATIALEQQLADAARDPQAAAIEYGKASGSCACCGRTLSDPVSIWGGIGPICLEKLAGGDARRQLEEAFKATQVGA